LRSASVERFDQTLTLNWRVLARAEMNLPSLRSFAGTAPESSTSRNRFFRDRSQGGRRPQETFLKAFAQMKSFAGLGSMEGWLTRIANQYLFEYFARGQAKTGAGDGRI